MKKLLGPFFKIILPILLGIFLIVYFYSKFTPKQWEELVSHFKNANYFIVFFSVILSLVSHIIRAYRWNFMLHPMGYYPKLINNYCAVQIAYLMNLFIPKSGEVSRAVVMDKYEKIPFEKGFGSIVAERIVDLIFLLLFTLIAVFLEFDKLTGYITSLIPFQKLILLFIMFIIFMALFYFLLKRGKQKWILILKTFIKGLKEGVFTIVTMPKKGRFIAYSVLIWLLYIFSFYVATLSLPETATINFNIVVITFVVGSFTFGFTNSGVGYYPLAIAGILLLFNIPETVGTALGWIVWTSHILSLVIIGVICLIAMPIINKK